MNDFASAFHIAFELIGSFNAELRAIILLSLQVSLTASVCAFAIGAPLGTALAVYRFPGRGMLVVIANTLPATGGGRARRVPAAVAFRAIGVSRPSIHPGRDDDRPGCARTANRDRARP